MTSKIKYRIFHGESDVEHFKQNLRVITKTSLMMVANDATPKPIVHISSARRLAETNLSERELYERWKNTSGHLLATEMICNLLPRESTRKIANNHILEISLDDKTGQVQVLHTYRITEEDINTLKRVLQQELIDYYNPALTEAITAREEKLRVMISPSAVDKGLANGLNNRWKKNGKRRN